MTAIDIPVGPIVANQVVTLRLKGVRVMQARIRFGAALLELIGRVLPFKVEVATDEPPPNTHDVAVEKIGVQMRLRIGDSAVRLDRGDARYIGELLSCGWVGQLNDVRAADER